MHEFVFDEQGHFIIRPCDLLEAAVSEPSRLVSDVLCHGTPAIFGKYSEYRDFVNLVSNALSISPLAIWVRGSAHVGFSIAPNPGKAWVSHGPESDIDLAIVDPDRYHLLDTEIRSWERSESVDFLRAKKLRDGRRYYQYRHWDLPSTPACDEYKEKVESAANKMSREVTAFFFRDAWSLHERWIKDLRDLVTESRIALPTPGPNARSRAWLTDGDLAAGIKIDSADLNLARPRSRRRLDLSDAGLSKLNDLGATTRMWIDSCAVTDLGIASLPSSANLTLMSLSDTEITAKGLTYLLARFPNLSTLVLDRVDSLTWNDVLAFCQASRLSVLSIRDCRWTRGRPAAKNSNGNVIRIYF